MNKNYVPFTHEDQWIFRDKWVKHLPTGNTYRILGCEKSCVLTLYYNATYEHALEIFEFEDGTPFGKKV